MIIVDSREPANIEALFERQRLEVEIKRDYLDVGDYLVKSEELVIPVERKTTDDYVSSLFTKHLNNQLYKLSYNYPFSFLAVVGSFDLVLYHGRITTTTLISSLISVSTRRAEGGYKGQISLIQLPDDYTFVLFLYLLHNRVTENRINRELEPQGKKETREDILLMLYKCLPSIGAYRARKLLETFPSFSDLLNATEDEIAEVEGIGRQTAEKILKVLR